jgi:8-oxo-dGTP diphosphatase
MNGESVRLHIAVGVVSDAAGRILISERKPDCAYAGQWEFPGGKCEPGEEVEQALTRELREELDIEVQSSRPLIRLSHRYSDRHVLLDTWRVTAWQGRPAAREGQRFDWVAPMSLDRYPMLAANRPIVRAVQLPASYLITPVPGPDSSAFLAALDRSLAAGVRMVRLRAPQLSRDAYQSLARACLQSCRRAGTWLLLDRDAGMVEDLGADGLHLTVAALATATTRPLQAGQWLAASCHARPDLERAIALGIDFAVLGPVACTPSHPDHPGIGWEQFGRITGDLAVPVYGIGGLGLADLEAAWGHRAQGIAAIHGLWKS